MILLVYIFIDIFLDYFRTPKRSNVKRVLLYSFLFYILSVVQAKFGGITLPPINPSDTHRTYIIQENWFGIFDTMHFNISIWSYSAIFYNLVLFVPLGFYLAVLFNLKAIRKAVSIVFLTCIGIEICRILLEAMGLVTIRNSALTLIINLLINIVGGVIGFKMVGVTLKRIKSFKHTSYVKEY
ncbi:VanZ family protein [Ureibacillus aquaedulcis]|uniref:VanZ family protein n=1 Tax=Ureibacillus aquaedulcis TaxID=3058421 RepID=UPI0031F2DCF7